MNHPSDTPDECCPVCFGDGTIDVDDLPKVRAAAQALADVRTLDEWCEGQLGRRWCCEIADEDGWRAKLFGTSIKAGEHYGATPDEARAEATAWVRAQNL